MQRKLVDEVNEEFVAVNQRAGPLQHEQVLVRHLLPAPHIAVEVDLATTTTKLRYQVSLTVLTFTYGSFSQTVYHIFSFHVT